MSTVNITTISTSSYNRGWSPWSKDQTNAFGYSSTDGCLATAIRFTVPRTTHPCTKIRFSIPIISMIKNEVKFTAFVSLTKADPTKTSVYTETSPGRDPSRVYMSMKDVVFSDSSPVFLDVEIDVRDLSLGGTMYLVLSADGDYPYAARIESGANIKCSLVCGLELSTASVSLPSTILGEVARITIATFDSGLTHTLRYSINGVVGLIAENILTFCDWAPDISLAEFYPSDSSGQCTIICETYADGELAGSTEIKHTLVIPDSLAPKVRLSTSPVNDNPIVDAWGKYLQNYSRIHAVSTCTAQYGATITKCYITIDGVVYEGTDATSDIIREYGRVRVEAVVTDSRGFTTTATDVPVVKYYSPPRVQISACHRCENSDVYSRNGENYYVNATVHYSTLDSDYTATVFTRFRTVDGVFGDKSVMSSGVVGPYTVKGIYGGGQLSQYQSYVVEILITDELHPDGYSVYTTTIPQTKKSFHIKDGGRGVAIGTFAEIDDLFDIGYDTRFQADVEIDSEEPVILFKSKGVLAGAIGSHSVDGVLGDMFIRVYDSTGAYKEYTWSAK